MDLDKAEADIIVGELLWTQRPHMHVAICSSCSICLRTRWIYLDTTRNRGRLRLRASVAAWTRGSCPHQWRRPGSAGRCATRPKPPQCRRCGAAAPPRRLLESAHSCCNLARCVSGEDCREKSSGKSSLRCAKEEDTRQGGYTDGERADLCARWPIFSRVLKDQE